MAVVTTIAGVDRSAVVKNDTIRITQLADSYTFTAELVVFDASSNISITAGSHLVADEITIVDGATTFFGGYVANQDIESFDGGARNLHLQCQGYGILLTETLVEYEEYTATADDAIIDDLFDTYLAAIDSVTYVAQLDAGMDILFSEMSLAEILEALCQRTGGKFYIDNTKALHYFADENDDCGFDLSDEADQVGSFSYFDATEKRVDGSQIVNRVRVIGADGYATNRNDAASQASYGVRATIVTDQSLTTTAELEERGDAVLARHKDPHVTYPVKTYHGGAVAGQEVDYKNDVLGVDDTFTIREMYIYWKENVPIYEMVLGEAETFALSRQAFVSSTIREVVINPNVPIAARGWGHDLVFSASDNDTVAWTGGTITTAGGLGSYSIDAGNTGNMAATTYVYLDVDTSLTVLQTTTSVADAIGLHKILVAVCKNMAAGKDALFQVFAGEGRTALIVADEIGADQVTANLVGANEIITAAANIASAVIRNAHIDSTYANRIQANKIRIGDTPFTPDAGLLLLGQPMRFQRGATNYWVSSRKHYAEIVGAPHPVQGKWRGTQALIMEIAATNLDTNPTFGVDTTGYTTAGTNTIAVSTAQVRYGTNSCKCTYQDNTSLIDWAATLSVSTEYSVGVWVYIPSNYDGDQIRLWIAAFTGATGTLTDNADMTKTDQWQRLSCTFTLGPAETNGHIFVHESVSAPTAGRYIYVDAWNITATPAPGTHIDGTLGDGYAWTGAAHGSTSTRAVSYIKLDSYTTLVGNKNTVSITCLVQMPYDSDADWPSSICQVWDYAQSGDNNNRVYLAYLYGSDTWQLYINGAVRCISSAQTFSAGDWMRLTATLDFSSDEYILYVGSVLEDSDTTSLTAPGGLTDWVVGANYGGSQQAGYGICEFAVFGDVLTAVEIADIVEMDRPMVDYGSLDTPGILLTSHDGNRIEITAYELAVYEDNDKCVEVDSDGIAILVDTSYADIRSYQFVDSSGAVISQVKALKNPGGGDHYISLIANDITGYDSIANVEADSPTGEIAQANLTAYHGAGTYATVTCNITTGEVSSITFVVDGNIQAQATTTGLAVYGLSGEVWEFGSVSSGADLAATRRLHVKIDGSQYTILAVTGWV